MEIRLISEPIPLAEIKTLAQEQFGEMLKATVDVDHEIMAVGGELHSDEEALLLDRGSKQESLWGINIYPAKPAAERVEFDSMINVRPSRNNLSRGVEDPATRERILRVVSKLIR
jgi:hypothetical protein